MKILLNLALFCSGFALAQSYAPQVGTAGSTAISKDSPLFKSWATNCEVVRGRQQINGTAVTYATVGTPANGTGAADESIVSLGDGGTATVTFSKTITNGPGADFAVFENGFNSNFNGRAFLELAFVEVSSDGINFFRFPSHNEYSADYIQNADDLGGPGFATMDARYLNNFAGKYLTNYGTPFDLSDLPDNLLLDKTKISHVKLIDVVGTNIDGFRTYDSFGNIAVDPFPTPFASSGFDFDAVGVINETVPLSVDNASNKKIKIYPNPATDFIKIDSENDAQITIFDPSGKRLKTEKSLHKMIDITSLPVGNYIIVVDDGKEKQSIKLMKSK